MSKHIHVVTYTYVMRVIYIYIYIYKHLGFLQSIILKEKSYCGNVKKKSTYMTSTDEQFNTCIHVNIISNNVRSQECFI